MYYILYEGLQIESNEPVYCTVYTVHTGVQQSNTISHIEY